MWAHKVTVNYDFHFAIFATILESTLTLPLSIKKFLSLLISVNVHIFNSTFKISITTFKMVPNKSINGNIN